MKCYLVDFDELSTSICFHFPFFLDSLFETRDTNYSILVNITVLLL
jgi:hypothetical protein